MRILLGGGGNAQQSVEVDRFFASMSPSKTIAYLPQAAVPKLCTLEYAENWLKDRPAFNGFTVESFLELNATTLQRLCGYDRWVLGGGNTFDLLLQFRAFNVFETLKKAVKSKTIIYGISAGAIILGENVLCAGIGPEADSNDTDLTDFGGANLLRGFNVITHYKTEYANVLTDFADRIDAPVIGIPEEGGAFCDGVSLKNISIVDLHIIRRGKTTAVSPGATMNIEV